MFSSEGTMHVNRKVLSSLLNTETTDVAGTQSVTVKKYNRHGDESDLKNHALEYFAQDSPYRDLKFVYDTHIANNMR